MSFYCLKSSGLLKGKNATVEIVFSNSSHCMHICPSRDQNCTFILTIGYGLHVLSLVRLHEYSAPNKTIIAVPQYA